MAPRFRWLLFWYLVPTIVVVIALVVGDQEGPNFLGLIWLSSLPVLGYLAWAPRSLGWLGPMPLERWKRWLPPALTLWGGYLLLFAGAEPFWAEQASRWMQNQGWPDPEASFAIPTTLGEGVLLTIGVGLAVPIVEEALFRGPLLRVLARWWGHRAAIGATALIFGFCHADGQVFKVILGLGLGWLAWRSRSLVVPITVHALVNLTAVAAAVVAAQVPDTTTASGDAETLEAARFTLVALALVGVALLGRFWWLMDRGLHPGLPARPPRRRVGGPRRPRPLAPSLRIP